jgi:hypothetical protein
MIRNNSGANSRHLGPFSIDDNPELLKVVELLNNTDLNILVSGKAGSGKTSLLHDLKRYIYKEYLITAPTGVAAINAGGITLHSLFQLQVGNTYLPETNTTKGNRLSSERRKLIKGIDLLIIDEVSMLRADLLDAIDQILQEVRVSSEAFGGLQLMFVGDLYQLPPVCKHDEWKVLSQFYQSPLFIDARVLSKIDLVIVDLKKVYRQHEGAFVNILNKVRVNSISKEELDILNKKVVQGVGDSLSVTLTTHNELADKINTTNLAQQEGDVVEINAVVDGDFDTGAVIADVTLKLKVGAPVMLIRNFEHGDQSYFNGKIGILECIGEDELSVRFDDQVLPLRKAVWQSFDYSFDEANHAMLSKVTGSLEQFPVRLAWAITIHKSQGLSFDLARIDVEKAFVPGQVYVALSRLRSIEGLTLSAPITSQQVLVDSRIVDFFKFNPEVSRRNFDMEKLAYLKGLLTSWLNFASLTTPFGRAGANTKTDTIINSLVELNKHALKFCEELTSIFDFNEGERQRKLSTRLTAAVNYFDEHLKNTSAQCQELIKTYQGDVLYKKVLIFIKTLRKDIELKRYQLTLARKIAVGIADTQDLGKILREK